MLKKIINFFCEKNTNEEYWIIVGLLSGIMGSGLLQGVAEVAGNDNKKASVYFIGSTISLLLITLVTWKNENIRSRILLILLFILLSITTYYFFF